MKIIIAGSRHITSPELVRFSIDQSSLLFFGRIDYPGDITEIVSGKAKGVDSLGEDYAGIHGIPVKSFPADWKTLGRKAGIIRNCQMGDYADACIAVWDGKSSGTENMISYMLKLQKPVCVAITNDAGNAVLSVTCMRNGKVESHYERV